MTSQENSWKNSLSFLDPPHITHKVGDKSYKFYALSLPVIFKLNSIAKPLAKALTSLFTSTKNDTGVKDMRFKDEKGKEQDTQVIMDPISVELASLRHKQKQEAIDSLMGILSEENIEPVGEIIMDSLCDIFPRGSSNNPPAKEFLDSVPLPSIVALLIGVAKANKGVLDPLVGNFQGKFKDILEKVGEQITSKLPSVMEQPQGHN